MIALYTDASINTLCNNKNLLHKSVIIPYYTLKKKISNLYHSNNNQEVINTMGGFP